MEKSDIKRTFTTIETVDSDKVQGYDWKTKLEYEDNKFTDSEINEAKLMAKLLVETYRIYYNNPPTHIDIRLRDRSILNDRHVEVEVKVIDENAPSRQGFSLGDFDWEFEGVLANHFEEKRFNLLYDLKKKYAWVLTDINVGGYTFMFEATFDII